MANTAINSLGEVRVLALAGTPRERGRRHGEALAREIRRIRRALLTYLVRAGLIVGALPLAGLLSSLSWAFWPHIPARLKEEMRGLAAGAGLDLPTVLLINVLDDLANNTPRCSALAAGQDRTPDGAFLAGRNLDYPLFTDILAELQVLFVLESDAGLPVASLAWPGYVGVCTGMNSAGVALSQLTAMSRDSRLKGIPAALRFRQALESGGSVARVAAALLAAPATIGNNVLLASAGEARVLELSPRGRAVRSPVQGLLTVTNHYQSREMTPLKGSFPRRPPFAVLSPYHFTEAYSRSRDWRLQELAAGKKLEPTDIQDILADPEIANAGTVSSVVFAPAARTIWVARGARAPVNRGPFQEIRLWQRE